MNKVILMGRLTKDPELRFAAGSGTAVTRFSIAVTRAHKREEADFINCVSFGKTAETIAQYFSKGKPIAITGSIRTGSYDDKDGNKRYTTDVAVDTFEFVLSDTSAGANGNGNSNTGRNSSSNGGQNSNAFDAMNSDYMNMDDMTPVDDGDMPF